MGFRINLTICQNTRQFVMNKYLAVPIHIALPEESGRYIVQTKSTSKSLPNTGNVFECMFNHDTGKWDCHNQIVTHWFDQSLIT